MALISHWHRRFASGFDGLTSRLPRFIRHGAEPRRESGSYGFERKMRDARPFVLA
ncbi:MAG TPA: hypothetical protein VEZ26_08640 [Sphingomonadaceae bacterium]|nr:hypothetical protein [Sphingomonadaceae bacterium]